MIALLVFTLFVSSCYPVIADWPSVKTNIGLVEGAYKQSYNGREYSAFEGIPYAKPPISELRFREPISPEPWIGILNATTTYTCMQSNMFTGGVSGDEDCLYLNVYVPTKTAHSSNNFDVVVHFHGGGFMQGDPKSMSGPLYLMDKNLLYVNINYRVGVLGFLSTEDEVVPGNMGMKDQAMALKWIHDNIKHFGGNPNSVTITGISAGGASVHFHYFSELSKGLFHRGFSQSGTAFAPWALQEEALQRARHLAALVGCDFPSSKAFVNCMRHRSAKQLIEYAAAYLGSSIPGVPIAIFAPIVERKSNHAFLIDQPYNLLKAKLFNDVPWITAIASSEGAFAASFLKLEYDNINKHWNDVAHFLLDYNNTVCSHQKSKVAQQIRNYYYGSNPISEETVDTTIKLVGDRYFANSFEEAARLQAAHSKSPVFSYIYRYKASSRQSLFKLFGMEKDFDVTHGEEGLLMYELNLGSFNSQEMKLSEDDIKIKDVLINILMASFANNMIKIGTVNWNPVIDSDEFSYLSVAGPDDIKMVTVEEITPRLFWNSLPIMENEKAGFQHNRDNVHQGKTEL